MRVSSFLLPAQPAVTLVLGLGLKKGDEVTAVVKATEVMISK